MKKIEKNERKYVEYKTKNRQALVFIIVYLLIATWINLNILPSFIDSEVIFTLIMAIEAVIGYVAFNSRFFKIRHEYDVEINEETRQVNILDYNKVE